MSPRRIPPPTPPGHAPVPLAETRRRRAIARTLVARAVVRGYGGPLRHGVYSEAQVRDDVLDECSLLYARAPWLDEVRDGILVEATARILVRLRRLDAIVDAEPTATLTSMLSRLEGQLTRNLDALGLTPTAAARLGLHELDARAKARALATDGLAKYRRSDG